MFDFQTIEEKALEWDVTPRHLQSLCRKGKIKGAIKRGGIWFIPDNVPNPMQNTKADAQHIHYVGTKKEIFDCARKLFVQNGIDSVTFKDIANHVGINQSAMYNHFKSKQEILDAFYDFFCYYYFADRPSLEDIESILHHGSLLDIVCSVKYDFSKDYLQDISDIISIIFQRHSADDRAKEIGKHLILDEGIAFAESVFNRAVEIGRLMPFDTHALSVFVNSISLYSFYNWILDPSPENMRKIANEEQTQYRYATKLLTDLHPPKENSALS